jgi:hypothetical protein
LIDNKIDKDDLIKKIQSVITENDIEFIGLNAEGLAQGIMMCLK